MNTTTFELSIYIGLVFSSMYIIVGFLVDFMGKKLILLVVLTSTGLCGIGAQLVQNQNIAVVLFAIFQMCGACIGLTNAVTVELFPTKYRWVILIIAVIKQYYIIDTNYIIFIYLTPHRKDCLIAELRSFLVFATEHDFLLCFFKQYPQIF